MHCCTKIFVNDLPQFLHLPGRSFGPLIEGAIPLLDALQSGFRITYGLPGFADLHLLHVYGIVEDGNPRREQLLLTLFKFAAAQTDFLFPMGRAIKLQPHPGADDFLVDLVQNAGGLFAIDDQFRAKRLEGFEGCDLGAFRHDSMLVQIFLDALGFAEEIRRVLV